MAQSVVVVGGGISGAACAQELHAHGLDVRVVDRGRRVGGRMASRSSDGRPVDLGASYLTASSPEFSAVVDDWHARGLARPWTRRFTVLAEGEEPSDKEGPLRWGASGGLRSLVEDLLERVPVEQREVGQVTRLDARWHVDGEAVDAVVLAVPDPQARRLLPVGDPAQGTLTRAWDPVLALAARWEQRTWDRLSPGGTFHGAFVNDDEVLDFVADDGRRRGDDAPVLVAHSTPGLAARHLDDPQAALPEMLETLTRRLGLADPVETHLHRWSFARPAGERVEPFHLADGLGVCGDGWGEQSKVETAWTSGARLGRALVRQLTRG